MSSRRMELTGLHRDIVEAGPFIQIRDANIPVAWCADLPRSSRSCQSTAPSYQGGQLPSEQQTHVALNALWPTILERSTH